MKTLLLGTIFGLFAAVGSAWGQVDYCFKNEGLKVRQIVSFTVTKDKLEGTFLTDNPEQERPAVVFEFTGTKSGKLLTIKFKDKMPYEIAPGTRVISWTLARQNLKIPMYGKNSITPKPSAYTATFAKCKEI